MLGIRWCNQTRVHRPRQRRKTLTALTWAAMCCVVYSAHGAPERHAYFGDTHIHTMYSFDAFMGNVRTTPDDAYRYAKGEPIDHPAGMKLRITGPPLDFLMVSDHAKYLGVFAAQIDPEAPFLRPSRCSRARASGYSARWHR